MAEGVVKGSKSLDPDFEPAGGLPQALQRLLAKCPGHPKVEGLDEPSLARASVSTGFRSSQVMVAADIAAFSVDFWVQGVQYGSGWAKSLDEVANAICAFQGHQAGAADLQAAFPWVRVYDRAFIHERGPAAFVEDAWRSLIDWLAGEPPSSHQRRLLPLVRACVERPRLRRLMPFTSHDRLCFSRTTGFPYTTECPPAFPLGDGQFQIAKASAHGRPVDGDAESTALALERVLPADCPGAVHGTARDLDGAS